MTDTEKLTQEVAKLTPTDSGGMLGVQAQRAISEIQGAMTIAKRFPRDEKTACARIAQACGRKSLAGVAIYEYPRGGQKVSGPSIRLAEALAQCWGNIDSGVIELERRAGESTALAYCVDLETNYRKTMVFNVPHTRDTQKGKKNLTDDRDIYERVANDGSRRLRNCILAVIPGDVVDDALAACEKTLTSDNKESLQDRLKKMMIAMADYGVTREMIEQLFGCKVEAISEAQLLRVRRIYQSLQDGVGKVDDFFKGAKVDTASELEKKLNPKSEEKPASVAATASKVEPQVLPAEPSDADDSFENFKAPHKLK